MDLTLTGNQITTSAVVEITGDISSYTSPKVVFLLSKFMPNASADYVDRVVAYGNPTALTISEIGESTIASANFTLDPDWDLAEINAVCLVQSWTGTKNIIQAQTTGFTGIMPLIYSNVTSGPAELTVDFSDSSLPSGGIESWEWDLDGDGTFDSTEQNPSFTYTTPGSYDITLKIFDGSEYVESTFEDYITVLEPGVPFSGKLAGNWSSQYNPYIISANSTIEAGDLLNIAAGTEIIIQDAALMVYGEIYSVAEENNKTSFSSETEWDGIRVIGSEAIATFLHNKFSNATEAAISLEDEPLALVQQSLFVENHSGAKAAAIEISNASNVQIYQNVIKNNSSASGPAAIACLGADPQIKNNLIYGNSANFGAFAFKNNSVPIVINNTVADNSSESALMIIFNSLPIVRNNILRDEAELALIINSAPEFTYNNISGGMEGTGNIDADPLFVDAANGNYLLAENSPCIDAGDPAADFNDPDGSINDMGAWGGPLALDGVPLNAEEEISPQLNQLAISIYPNPFGAASKRSSSNTTISFQLAADSQNNNLEIYNLRGQKIRTWQLTARQNSVVWDGKDQNQRALSNGLYLIKLQSDQATAVQKAVLLK
ncbi:MAG: PKD domain-containing protein [Candidatus Cloacimonadales bacterium]